MSGRGSKRATSLSADPGVRSCRRLHVVFGDQLSDRLAAFDHLDPERDVLLLAEVAEEQTWVPVHRQRSVLFLSAMRHFTLEMQEKGWRVRHVRLDQEGNEGTLSGEVRRAAEWLSPETISCTHPGEWRVLDAVQGWEEELGVPVEIHEDTHFLCSIDQFAEWASDRRSLVMEHFYRVMRRRHDVLVGDDGEPAGGRWNYDEDNREPFDAEPDTPTPYRPRIDDVTRDVIDLVLRRHGDNPGHLSASSFAWPVTRAQAKRALKSFVDDRLEAFGRHQDATWTGRPFLNHSLLSPAMNLHLLDPREVIDAAVAAWKERDVPLASVEGFVRQVLGWREFVRGVYWFEGRGYRKRNGLGDRGDLPKLYWTGETDMACLRDAVAPVLEHGYAHHIQRLMVHCNFALLAGVQPRQVGDWFYGMFVDSVDWVTTPNTIGMGMHADHGVVGTKPYVSSARYIDRMGNACGDCRYDPGRRTSEDACPFNSLYWDFIDRHRERFEGNRRMTFPLATLKKLDPDELKELKARAARIRGELGIVPSGG